jgi:hypothetical protein
VQCDPETCPGNKGYGKTSEEAVKENVSGVGFGNLPTLKEIRTGDAANKAAVARSVFSAFLLLHY